MSTEKNGNSELPLHVAVAVALGWTHCYDRGDGLWLGDKPANSPQIEQEIPRFDLSFCACGPVLEKLKLGVTWDYSAGRWIGERHSSGGYDYVSASTPTLAVCDLILALSKEGKLKA